MKQENKNHKEHRNLKLNPANIKHKKKKYLLEKSWSHWGRILLTAKSTFSS